MIAPGRTIYDVIKAALEKRQQQDLYRSLQVNEGLVDFCSNDYLSLARSEQVRSLIMDFLPGHYRSGSTGSRSISGNSTFAEDLEAWLATFHHAESGLLFNSGYDANVGLFSSVLQRGDTVICDELVHASIIDGCRLSHAQRLRFVHNDADDLELKLKRLRLHGNSGSIFVAIESVYSMDGDIAPLKDIVDVCNRFDAALIVDEAHATGVFGSHGRGLLNEAGLENEVFARVVTFGKAIGAHGAIVLGNRDLRNYLINFARSFIFTTALPVHSLATIKSAYSILASAEFDNSHIHKLISKFSNEFRGNDEVYLIRSRSPVQSVVIPGSQRVRPAARLLQQRGFDVRGIVSPSVAPGKERLRISLHMHNSVEEVNSLLSVLNEIIFA